MSNLNLNNVVLGGRLVADPEIRATQSGVKVANIRLAINRSYSKDGNRETDYIDVIAWRQGAELLEKYFRKGSAVCVIGSIQSRTWEDQNGQKRYATEVVADQVKFVDGKSDGAAPAADNGGAPVPPPEYNNAPAPAYEELKTDDDLPF